MFYCPTPQNSQDFQPQIPKIFNFEVIFPYIILLNNIILRSVKYRASRGTLLRSPRTWCSRKRQHRPPLPPALTHTDSYVYIAHSAPPIS